MNSVPAAPSRTGTDTLTRVIAGLIFVILLDASQLLFLYPDRTDTLWAWKLQPEATAMLLGSVYAGGGYFFARAMFGAPWQRVAAGFPAVIVFVWMAAIATLLHLDRFVKDSVPFVAWVALYVVTPLVVPWLVARNHRLYGAPNRIRAKKYPPPAYTEPSSIAVTSGSSFHAHSSPVRAG